MKWLSFMTAVSILILLFVIAYALVVMGVSGPPAPTTLRVLGEKYLYYMINPYYPYLRAESPEAVSAILWDYRGLDTLYETMVLFAAIIGAVLIYRDYLYEPTKRSTRVFGLSLIVRTVSKIVIWLTLITALALGLTGQLTPGGGFVGGAAFAVIPVLLVLVYTIGYAEKLGFTKEKALLLRTSALLLLLTVIIAPYLVGGYVFQNQPKPGATDVYYPPRFLDQTPLGGSLFFLNLIELFAVAGAFTLSFVLLGIIAGVKEEGGKE